LDNRAPPHRPGNWSSRFLPWGRIGRFVIRLTKEACFAVVSQRGVHVRALLAGSLVRLLVRWAFPADILPDNQKRMWPSTRGGRHHTHPFSGSRFVLPIHSLNRRRPPSASLAPPDAGVLASPKRPLPCQPLSCHLSPIGPCRHQHPGVRCPILLSRDPEQPLPDTAGPHLPGSFCGRASPVADHRRSHKLPRGASRSKRLPDCPTFGHLQGTNSSRPTRPS
jgi:hypothetical protein